MTSKRFTASNGLTVEAFPDCFVFRSNFAETTREISPSEVNALRDFFAHEREVEHKPWLGAREGDVWIISLPQGTYPAIFQADMFRDHGGSWSPHDVTAARKLWSSDV